MSDETYNRSIFDWLLKFWRAKIQTIRRLSPQMAKFQRIIALNLGAQTIRAAEFQPQPNGGLLLCSYYAHESLIDPSNERIDEDEFASLHKIVSELQIKGRQVNYAVAAQSVFTRFVRLPAVEHDKVDRIIAFEAQQNVPFPIDEVIWDYHWNRDGGGEQGEAVLVAIKSNLLDEINGAVEETGLRTGIVDVETLTLYNAFRYNYAGLTGCSLLIDLGARTTNLLFIESEKVFSRSIAIGGSSITSAIAKDFNEPFAAAELRKKRDGFVSVTAPGESIATEVSRVSKLVHNTMTRLHAEVMRSISHYRTQQKGNAPKRVFLCGGTSSLPFMNDFFRKRLGLPVELFNPLQRVRIGHVTSLRAHEMGELVGLALRSVITCPIEIDLRPKSVVRRHELEKRRPLFGTVAGLIVLMLVGWGFFYVRAAEIARDATKKLQIGNSPMRAAEAKIENLRKGAAALDAMSEPVADAINDRFFWVELLQDLNARLPKENIWITELIPLSGRTPIDGDEKNVAEIAQVSGRLPLSRSTAKTPRSIDGLLLRGLYLFNPKQQEVVVEYFRNLVSSPFFNIDPNNQGRVIKSTIPNDTEWAFPYELHLDLRRPMKLP